MALERVHNNITPKYSLEPSSKPMHAKQGSEEEPSLISAFFLAKTCKLEVKLAVYHKTLAALFQVFFHMVFFTIIIHCVSIMCIM